MLLVITLTMNLWNIKKLKDDLSNQKVNQRDLLVYYFLIGLTISLSYLGDNEMLWDYQDNSFKSVQWFVTTFIYLATIFLCYKANKGSRGNNFIERIFSLEILLLIRYVFFFIIPYVIFYFAFLEDTVYADIGDIISTIILELILAIRTIQCMKDIQKI